MRFVPARAWFGSLAAIAGSVSAQNADVRVPLASPMVGEASWVLVEIWPAVKDVTLSAYFLEELSGKNQKLCMAVKDAIDRDAKAVAKAKGYRPTAYRLCMTVGDAKRRGFISKE